MNKPQCGDLVYCDPPYTHSQSIIYGAQTFDIRQLWDQIAECKDRGVYVMLSINGTRESKRKDISVEIPNGLFEREVIVNCGTSMIDRLQNAGKGMTGEVVHDKLLLTWWQRFKLYLMIADSSIWPSPSEQDKSVVAIRRFFVTRKRQTAAFERLAVKDTAAKTKPLISKENAQNRPETIQRDQVLGVSAFREQIGNSAVKRRCPLCPVCRNTSSYLSKVRGQWSRTGAPQSEDILQFCLDCQAVVLWKYHNLRR